MNTCNKGGVNSKCIKRMGEKLYVYVDIKQTKPIWSRGCRDYN